MKPGGFVLVFSPCPSFSQLLDEAAPDCPPAKAKNRMLVVPMNSPMKATTWPRAAEGRKSKHLRNTFLTGSGFEAVVLICLMFMVGTLDSSSILAVEVCIWSSKGRSGEGSSSRSRCGDRKEDGDNNTDSRSKKQRGCGDGVVLERKKKRGRRVMLGYLSPFHGSFLRVYGSRTQSQRATSLPL